MSVTAADLFRDLEGIRSAALQPPPDAASLARTLTSVYRAMDPGPLTCTLATDMDEVRRMMLERHARYMPVIDNRILHGVISFYDVAKAVVDAQNFENRMLKAYIRDWPEEEPAAKAEPGAA